jgi:hypothetical protein
VKFLVCGEIQVIIQSRDIASVHQYSVNRVAILQYGCATATCRIGLAVLIAVLLSAPGIRPIAQSGAQ